MAILKFWRRFMTPEMPVKHDTPYDDVDAQYHYRLRSFYASAMPWY